MSGSPRIAEQCGRIVQEMVRAQNVQIDHGAHARLRHPAERGLEQVERLGLAPAVLRPHLFLVDGQAQMIEPVVTQPQHVLALEKNSGAARRARMIDSASGRC